MNKKLNDSRKAFEALGNERETAEQQRRLLLDIISNFQNVTQHAISTNYGMHDIFDADEDVRLATLVSNRNATFSDDVSLWGHEYNFQSESQETELEEDSPEYEDEEDFDQGAESVSSEIGIKSRKVPEIEDVQEIVQDSVGLKLPIGTGISSWIETIYRDARGFEIGTFNHTLLSTLMKKQSTKWPILARGYVSDIITIVHRFILKVLKSVCADSKVSENIASLLMDDLMHKYRQAISVVEFLLKIEREGTPMTLNHYLNDNLQKW